MGKKILLADDSITIQKVIELTFSDEDFDVVTVGNGRLAVERVQDVRPDLVLCDIIMPEKDGYEVCEFIKTNPSLSHIPVLLLTGAFEPFDQDRANRAGCDGFLAKPFEPQTLIAKVKELLNRAGAKGGAAAVRPAAPPSAAPPAPAPASLAEVAASQVGEGMPWNAEPASRPGAFERVPEPLLRFEGTPAEASGSREPARPAAHEPPAFIPADAFSEEPPLYVSPDPPAPAPAMPSESTSFPDPSAYSFEDYRGSNFDEVAPAVEHELGDMDPAVFEPEPRGSARRGSGHGEPEPALPELVPMTSEEAASLGTGGGPRDADGGAPGHWSETVEVPLEARAQASMEAGQFEGEPLFEEVFDEEPPPPPARPVSSPAPAASAPTPVEPASPRREPTLFPAPAATFVRAPEPMVAEPLMPAEPLMAAAPARPARTPETSFADLASRPEPPPAARPSPPPPPASASPSAAVAAAAASAAAELSVPVDMVSQIAQRVVAQISEKVIREIAWEVIPELAEALLKKEIERLKAELQET